MITILIWNDNFKKSIFFCIIDRVPEENQRFSRHTNPRWSMTVTAETQCKIWLRSNSCWESNEFEKPQIFKENIVISVVAVFIADICFIQGKKIFGKCTRIYCTKEWDIRNKNVNSIKYRNNLSSMNIFDSMMPNLLIYNQWLLTIDE